MKSTTLLKPQSFSKRQLRVGEVIRRALSEVFSRGDVYDSCLARVTLTIAEVRMSPDLKQAFIFALPLAQPFTKELQAALKREAPRLRSYVGKSVSLRFTPELRFVEDKSFDEAQKINTLLLSPEVSRDLA